MGQCAAVRVTRLIGEWLERDRARRYEFDRDRTIIDAAAAEL